MCLSLIHTMTALAVYLFIDFKFLVSWLKVWQHKYILFNRLHTIWTWHLLLKSQQSLTVRVHDIKCFSNSRELFSPQLTYIVDSTSFRWKLPNSESIPKMWYLLKRGIYVCENILLIQIKFWKVGAK